VKTLTVEADGSFDLDMVNNGNTKDTVVSISVPPGAALPIAAADGELLPHAQSFTLGPIVGADGDLTLDATVTSGSTITVKINMASGLQLTQSVIVAPAA
jgi:hypothetical protein